MKTFLKLLNLIPFFDVADGGSGGGAGGAGGGAGDPGTGGAGGGGAAPHKFDPGASYDFGDGKPVKGSDYMAKFMPVEKFNQGRDFLMKEATRLENLYGKLLPNGQRQAQTQQQQQNQQQQRRGNPMEKFENASVVDGKMLSEAYKAMSEGDIAPMTAALQKVAQVVASQQAKIQSLEKGYGSINEQHASTDYKRKLTGGVESLGFSPEMLKAHPILNDIAEDVYLSHDPRDPNLDKEFGPMLKARVDSMIKFVRALDKAKLEEARNQKRVFMRPGGNGTPGKEQGYKHENGTSLARRLFSEPQLT